LGLAAAAWSDGQPWAVVAASLLWTLSIGLWRGKEGLLVLAGVVLVLAAGWRYTTVPRGTSSDIGPLMEVGPVRLRGVVDAEPQALGSAVRYRVAVRHVQVEGGWQAVRGRVLVTMPASLSFQYGDLLELEGELQAPPSFPDFDYRAYLARQGIGALMPYPRARWLAGGMGDAVLARIVELRGRLAGALEEALPEPEASLAQGVLLGKRGALPPQVLQDMDATGLSHLLAASGQNVALIAGVTTLALAWLVGRRQAALVGLALTGSYAFLVGGSPPVVRAAIMGGLHGLALLVGRPGGGLQPLLLAGTAMTAWDPLLADDLSFQLSFASTLGLVWASHPLQSLAWRWLEGRAPAPVLGLLWPLMGVMAMTVAAVAFTLPVMALNFGRLSTVALVANVLAVPAFAPLLLTSAVVAALGVVWEGLAPWLGWVVWPWAAYILGVAKALAALPGAVVSLQNVGMGHVLAYVAALGLATLLLVRKREKRAVALVPLPGRALAMLVLVALAGGVVWLWVSLPHGHLLRVVFMDVGDGAAALITTPAGHRVLIDGGPSGEALMAALGRNLPFWERRLDLVVVTWPKATRLGGLVEAMDRYEVGWVLAAPMAVDTALFRSFQEASRRQGVVQRRGVAGTHVSMGEAALEVLYPQDEGPMALRLRYGTVSFLFLSDLGRREQEQLLRLHSLKGDVVLLPRGGSGGSLDPVVAREMAPRLAILSVGGGGRSHRDPSPETLALLEGAQVLRTDLHGDIVVETDGRHLWVRHGR
jgi:competence protein ComEC